MVRVAFGGISHETNTFATGALGLTKLEQFYIRVGDQVTRIKGDYTGGMLDAARELGYDCIGLLLGITEPSGTIADKAFEHMRDELCRRLKESLPVDVVALECHGAGVAESYPDIEGALAIAVRAIVGEHVPIIGTFDLHGNISSACAAAFDFMCCVHEYPHTDPYERGLEAMRMAPRLLNGMRTTRHLEHVPALFPLCMMCTQPGFAAAEMNEFMYELERRPGVLDCTVFHGFPFADVPTVGASIIVTTENDIELARSIGREAGAWVWRNRERFRLEVSSDGVAHAAGAYTVDAHTPESAVIAAKRCSESSPGLIVVNEASDNTGCGAPGDATHLLRAILDAGFAPGEACFGWMYDPETLAQAQAVEVGTTFRISLGGKIDPAMCGDPIDAEATLLRLTDGIFESSPGAMFPGKRNLGPMAVLRVANVEVLVAGQRQQVFDYGAFALAGIDVREMRVVGLKSATHFRAAWAPIASKIITCEAPGWSSNNVETFEPMRKATAPRWPIDDGARYPLDAAAKL